jgi:hypothetical protein
MGACLLVKCSGAGVQSLHSTLFLPFYLQLHFLRASLALCVCHFVARDCGGGSVRPICQGRTLVGWDFVDVPELCSDGAPAACMVFICDSAASCRREKRKT